MADNKTIYKFIKEYNEGDIIFREGDESKCMYEVQKGKVDLYSNYGKPDQKKIAEVIPERFFGEMGMVEGLPRSATAVAATDFTSLAQISWDVLGLYFKKNPSRVVQIMQQMGDRLRITTKAAMDLRNVVQSAVRDLESADPESVRFDLERGLRNMDQTFGSNK